tara:strand:- start:169136 stop:170860 length:1725 start_codon:yes stop_codon:yes gene_type:complete
MAFFLTGVVSSQILFEEQASQLGADVIYGITALGGGISFFDYNQDGLDDITVTSEEGTNVFFLKNMGGTFEIDASISVENLQRTKQVLWVDINNNGHYDLHLTSDTGASRLYLNDGNLNFTDITDSSGLPLENHYTFGAAWGDIDNDGFLDLYLSNRSNGIADRLYRNNGDNTFTDVTQSAGLTSDAYESFCASFLDYNNDGFQDIYIAIDRFDTKNILYKNNGDGTFTDVSDISGTGLFMGAMSTTIGDYNQDGRLDIYVTNSYEDFIPNTTVGNALLENNGDGTFTNVADITGTTFNSVGWGAIFLDANNNTDTDIYVSGEFFDNPTYLPSAFYQNQGDNTYIIPENIGFEDDNKRSFANALGDVDNDGYPEMVVVNDYNEPIFLWKNLSNQTNNWLKVKLTGTVSNRQGIGSWIEIAVNEEKQYNYTVLGEGYLGQNSAYEFFGIGESASIDYVKVTWLSGIVDYIENPAINEHMTIVEGEHPLSAMDFNSAITFQVYPNPSKDKTISLKISENKPGDFLLDVSTVYGSIVLSKKITEPDTLLSLRGMSSGVYFFTLSNNQTRVTKKVVLD